MFTRYPIKDRVLPIVWNLQILNGFPHIEETDGDAFAEIVLRDEYLSNVYWLVHVRNGFIGVEMVEVSDYDTIIFLETETSKRYSLGIRNGDLKARVLVERTDISTYYLQDRILSIVWKMTIVNGFMHIEESNHDDQGEINVKDEYLQNTYWTIYLKNGVFGVESSSLEIDTQLFFREDATTRLYRLGVRNGVLRCPQVVILFTDEFNLSLVLKDIRTDIRKSTLPVGFEKPVECMTSDRRMLQKDFKKSTLPVSYERRDYE